MNDVRNLMHTLRGAVEYKEFQAPSPSARAASWALLERLERAVGETQVPQASEPHPQAEAEPVLATQLRVAAVARSARAGRAALSLGQYASATADQASDAAQVSARALTLTEVFARLARGGRPA